MLRSKVFQCVLSLFSLVLPLIACATDNLTLGSRAESSVPIAINNRDVRARLIFIKVHVSGSNFEENGVITAIYETASKQFWWMYQRWDEPIVLDSVKTNFLSEFRMVSDGDALIAFAATGRYISLRASSEKFASLEAGIDQARTQMANIASSLHRGKRLFTDLNLSLVLTGFFYTKGTEELGGAAGHGLILRSIKKTENGWDVEVGFEHTKGIVRNETRMIRIDNALSTATALPLKRNIE
jgi:hypothetical protein